MSIKDRLIKEYGSLRKASVKNEINYYRLSQIVNGWVQPKDEEIKKLQITEEELKCLRKE